MIQTIRVQTKQTIDPIGNSVLSEINSRFGKNGIKEIRTLKIYRLEGISSQQAKIIAEKVLCETLTHSYSINKPLLGNSSKKIEIGYKPGVMNPEVASILKAAKDLKINLQAADTGMEYGFLGDIKKDKINELATLLNLYNKTVEQIREEEPVTLQVRGEIGPTVIIPIRNMEDDELILLSKDKLFLNFEEMKTIQNYFDEIGRDPTDCELETLAQTWSEHSGHKTFKARLIVDGKEKTPLFSRIKKEALKHKKFIVSAFDDNSGVMDFYDGMAICGKGETHNSPSAIEPYGGAMTGSGGVFRDIVGTGQGAKNIVSTDVFCFASPTMDGKKLPQGTLAPKYLLRRVVEGVRDYGNRMGIPTNNGSIHFHEDFRARPTVFVGAYGIIPKKFAKIGKPLKGDLILSMGGKVGRDGIHGATFASGKMTDRTMSVNSSAVQIGNAIEEKRMFDAIIEARDEGLIRMIQDCGGGGLSSAIGEIGKDLGVNVDLQKVPVKYQGLSPWEIWISESQERMIMVVAKNKLKKFEEICKKYNTDVTVVGFFDGKKKLNVRYKNIQVCNLDMAFLHDGLPQKLLKATKPPVALAKNKPLKLPQNKNQWQSLVKKIVAHENVCSKEPIVRLYDHSVQGTNDLQPYAGVNGHGPNDAVVIRPLLNKPYGMLVAHGLNPILNRTDPYKGSIWAAVEAVSNYVSAGGNYKEASFINNYIWPFPDRESLWSLDQSVDAVVDVMKILKIPVISGKDSLSSTYRGKDGTVIKIPPVLCMSIFGRIKDATKTVSSDFKKENSVLYLLGKPDFDSMGGSTYFDITKQNGTVPSINLKEFTKVCSAIFSSIQKNSILSIHDISEGGMLTTLFEMALGGDMGAAIDISKLKSRPDFALLNETAGCFVAEVGNKKEAEELFGKIPHFYLGKTQKEKEISVLSKDRTLFKINVKDLQTAWIKPMQEIFS